MTEQNNELLMKSHESYLINTAPFSEVNVTTHDLNGQTCGRSHGCDLRRRIGCGGHGIRKNTFFPHKWKILKIWVVC